MRNTFSEFCNGSRIEVDIPLGFYFKEGKVDDGLVIEDNDGNQYVRIPSGYTADGVYVRGFWISRFEISTDEEGIPYSVTGKYPVVNINYMDAKQLAESKNGYLPTKDAYNRICMWLVESKGATFEQVFVRGNDMGNYSDPFVLAKTGSNPTWMISRLDNFFGNCYIWTTEKSELYEHYRVIRGGAGIFFGTDFNYPAACRNWANPENGSTNITLRIVLHDQTDETDD